MRLACAAVSALLGFCALHPPARLRSSPRSQPPVARVAYPASDGLPALEGAADSSAASPAPLLCWTSTEDLTEGGSAALSADALWEALTTEASCDHLNAEDVAHLRLTIDVLLAKAATAVRAIRRAEQDATVVDETPPHTHAQLQVLAVLSSVRTAADLLRLRLDAQTVASALLCEVITEFAPTWPASPLPDGFKFEVACLLQEVQAMRAVQRAVPDLSGAHASRVRGALFRAVQPANYTADGALPSSLQADPRALLVLLGAALTRLRAADLRPAPEQEALAVEAVQLYSPLAHAVGFGREFAELEELAYRRLFPEQYRRLQRWYTSIWHDAQPLLGGLRHSLEARIIGAPSLAGLLERVLVYGRVKSVASTFNKLIRDQTQIDAIRDICALRVILTPRHAQAAEALGAAGAPLREEEVERELCHGVYRQVLRLWPEVAGRCKDFVSHPKPNGYQSIHTNVRLRDGRVVEVQIRTERMHRAAEWGSASHGQYRAAQMGDAQPGTDGSALAKRAGRALRQVQLERGPKALPASRPASRVSREGEAELDGVHDGVAPVQHPADAVDVDAVEE